VGDLEPDGRRSRLIFGWSLDPESLIGGRFETTSMTYAGGDVEILGKRIRNLFVEFHTGKEMQGEVFI